MKIGQCFIYNAEDHFLLERVSSIATGTCMVERYGIGVDIISFDKESVNICDIQDYIEIDPISFNNIAELVSTAVGKFNDLVNSIERKELVNVEPDKCYLGFYDGTWLLFKAISKNEKSVICESVRLDNHDCCCDVDTSIESDFMAYHVTNEVFDNAQKNATEVINSVWADVSNLKIVKRSNKKKRYSSVDDALICKRAIKRLNKEVRPSCIHGADDFPNRFSIFDILSIQIQSMNMDEINPRIEDYIEDILEEEASKAQCESDDLYETFRKILDEHYYIKKIQNYIDRLSY